MLSPNQKNRSGFHSLTVSQIQLIPIFADARTGTVANAELHRSVDRRSGFKEKRRPVIQIGVRLAVHQNAIVIARVRLQIFQPHHRTVIVRFGGHLLPARSRIGKRRIDVVIDDNPIGTARPNQIEASVEPTAPIIGPCINRGYCASESTQKPKKRTITQKKQRSKTAAPSQFQ